jgi:hypothetical protein
VSDCACIEIVLNAIAPDPRAYLAVGDLIIADVFWDERIRPGVGGAFGWTLKVRGATDEWDLLGDTAHDAALDAIETLAQESQT